MVGGSGCQTGQANAALSPDAATLSILFDKYVVETGAAFGKNIDRKTCEIEVPIQIPRGYSTSVIRVDYRGFNSLPIGSQSRFRVEYYFTGNHGPNFMRAFYGPLQDDFVVSNAFSGVRPTWSLCGWDAPLRINTSMLLQSGNTQEHAYASVDSADIQAALVYQLDWRSCQGVDPRPPVHPFPAPGTYQGNCTIDQNPSNPNHFLVRNIYMDLVGQASNYMTALHIAELADQNGKCLGPVNPTPQPVTCILNAAGRQFVGVGRDQATASAQARRECMRAINHAPTCLQTGSLVCR